MFWSKNKKIGIIPLHTPVLLNKSGVQGGIDYMDIYLMKSVLYYFQILIHCRPGFIYRHDSKVKGPTCEMLSYNCTLLSDILAFRS